eukprot:CAMPEP_0180698238 /NCGR_PEP_ID=MMETSP1038_2-20121128/3919_1 /TAXON_ID=632150 /ORGANISM="Azadinium spinosum, Strain 3D9" /LENGTH=797 /DNA_ID=CAMNT_0022729797 /DNA_START=45 /DNA_END=2439 /DNA_ORIENTATION=+
MPLPWVPGKVGFRAKNVADRSVTVRQLRELSLLLQRLCKARVLKRTTEFSKSVGQYGTVIDWFEVNMFDISNEVIKKVIPFVDPDGKEDPSDPRKQWYSWAEFVAQKEQPPSIMVSHSWSGRFRDFMAVIDNLVNDKSLSVTTTIWICTFANNQFGEDFGVSLQQCPFIAALESVKTCKGTTVFIVDRDGNSLERVWCGLEVHYTIKNELNLEIYTPKVETLVEAMKSWDIRKGEATEPSYRRQVLNYIAGADERSGLLSTGKQLDLKDNRPQLADEDLDDEAPCRSNGDREFKYEASLFQRHAETFEGLNMKVRVEVMLNIGRISPPAGCKIEDAHLRGITLAQLRTMFKKLQVAEWRQWKLSENDQRYIGAAFLTEFSQMSIKMLVKNFVEPITQAPQCAYMELVADGPQKPRFFIECAWEKTIVDCMSSLESFVEAMKLPDSTTFWWDVFSLDRNKGEHKCAGLLRDGSGAGRAQHECEGLLLFVVPELAERLRILYSLDAAVRAGMDVYFCSRRGVLACTRPFSEGGWLYGKFEVGIARSLQSFAVRDAKCGIAKDREDIFRSLANSDDPDSEQGLENLAKFELRISGWVAGEVLRDAAAADQWAEICHICDRPGFSINSGRLKGSLGETPLHIALEMLLEMRADPDVEDTVGERPLHYAVLAGRRDSAMLLLKAGADPWAESSFGETASDVACNSPTAFLGINVAPVTAALQETIRRERLRSSSRYGAQMPEQGPLAGALRKKIKTQDLEVVVPDDVAPGHSIVIHHSGTPYSLVVPEGYGPGQVFRAAVTL